MISFKGLSEEDEVVAIPQVFKRWRPNLKMTIGHEEASRVLCYRLKLINWLYIYVVYDLLLIFFFDNLMYEHNIFWLLLTRL